MGIVLLCKIYKVLGRIKWLRWKFQKTPQTNEKSQNRKEIEQTNKNKAKLENMAN